MQQITIHSLQEMEAFGKRLAKAIEEQIEQGTSSILIALKGDLGAGKTTLTKAVAKALGVKKTVNSPTFTLVKSYQTSTALPLHHIDAYRLEGNQGPSGLEELFEEAITIIEWPQYLLELEEYEPLVIEIEKEEDEAEPEKRMLNISSCSKQMEKLEKRLA